MLDLIAQLIILTGMVLAVTPEGRSLLKDLEDGNVERLEREERRYLEALWWLSQMKETRL
jgi:hypothetical protein